MSVHEPPVWTPTSQRQSPEESSALSRISWFSIISLAGMVVTWLVSYFTLETMYNQSAFATIGSSPTPAQVAGVLGPLFQVVGVIIPVSIAIEVAGMTFLTFGFRGLKRVDAARFSTPSTMMTILIAGTLIAGIGVIPFFDGIPAILAQVPSTSVSTPSAALTSAFGSIIIYALVAVVGGLLALVGLIGGLILGLWRTGSRYGEPLFKIGAIFVVIPFLDVVAPILVLVAARQAKGRLPGVV